MARPTTRTAVVEMGGMRQVFGSPTQAMKNLELPPDVSFWVFQRAWAGSPVSPSAAQAIERGWRSFVDRMQRAPRQVTEG